MKFKVFRGFMVSAGTLLLATAVAKLISAGGNARILQFPDPIFAIPFRHVFWIVGVLELVIALVCLFGRQPRLQAGLLAWLATSFVIYRLALSLSGYHGSCHCLGNLTDALHISPQTADTVMEVILVYLLIGSYATLFWLWRQKRKAPTSTPSVEATKSVS
jgi:hypothetical protein